jgi:hypothetical protein
MAHRSENKNKFNATAITYVSILNKFQIAYIRKALKLEKTS